MRREKKVHVNRELVLSSYILGMGMLVSANISLIWAYLCCMQYHSLTPSHTVRHLHKVQTGNKQLKQVSKDKHSDIHEVKASIVLHVNAYVRILSQTIKSAL